MLERNGARLGILFGSHARGTADERSDVDLLIVDDRGGRYLDRLDRYFGDLWDALRAPVELVVYTSAELERHRDSPFISRVLREGSTIYER